MPGMIGGPKRVQIAFIMSDKEERGYYEDVSDAERTIRSWRADLRDDRVEYLPYARWWIADSLRIARRFIREAKGEKLPPLPIRWPPDAVLDSMKIKH